MAREFLLPDIGEGLTEADIVQWLVAEGERVEADQPIVEVETDKAVVEIPSPYAGTVLRHGAAEGDTLEVGAVLVVIGEAGETVPQAVADATDVAAAPPIVGTISEDAEVLDAAKPASPPRAAGVKALPVVRKVARELGVDLATVTGTGPGGQVTRDDVEAAASSRPATQAPPRETPQQAVEPDIPTPHPPASAPDSAASRRVPMTRLRRTIAANMSKSWSEIPHVTTFDDVDVTRLLEVRDALGRRHETKIPIEALVVKAALPALDAFPEFNATVDGDELIMHRNHDIGIAVDTAEGLMVAVVDDAGGMGVLDLAAEIRRLGEGARSRTLTPDELTGQTFTITNIGAVGGGHGTPIVPPGTTAILSVGRARQKPLVYGDDIVIAPVMPISMSYDHRVIDGAMGRRFISLVIENLGEPALFLAG